MKYDPIKKRKALFVCFEGFGNSIFQSQVVEHCESMKDKGFDFTVVTFEPFKKSWVDSQNNLNKYKKRGILKIFLSRCVNIYWPMSTLINLLLLLFAIKKNIKISDYEFIHARTEYSAALCLLLKPLHRIPVVWDCRGDQVDELLLATEKFTTIIRLALLLAFLPRQKLFIYLSNVCSSLTFCVSSALKDNIKSLRGRVPVVVPCPVPEDKFFFDINIRRTKREELGFNDEDVVFIYSGSMTRYQGIEILVQNLRSILSNSNAKILILTTDLKKAKEFFKNIDPNRLLITSCAYEEMNSYYCASDVGILLRQKRLLNWVASPTKFGEYCLTGLSVLHNASVAQAVEFSSDLGNGVLIEQVNENLKLTTDRVKISNRARRLYSRKSVNTIYIKAYLEMLSSTEAVND
jgi:glycosyltransferase involved in cell wall biosynthesis